jgi:UDP-N-acetylmuramate: L-alanyl-gamma-D-glutamyl-meso-diaminopimelate ligase
VLEGDEYDTAFFDKVPKFTHYLPKDVILTSVEYDHADIYPDIGAVIRAFDTLAGLVPSSGYFIACAETETPLRVAHGSRATVVSYGFGPGVDSRATHVELAPTGALFRWRDHRVKLNAAGRHNVLNALACLTLVHARGLDEEKAVAALASYEGVKRRQEVYASRGGVTLVDDFAHHPTAVRETISALKARYPTLRLVACFEPRSATSRRRVFQQAYAEAFDGADSVFIAKPYSPPGTASENPDVFSTEELLAALSGRGKRAKLLSTSDDGLKAFARELRSGDLVLVMSNGGFDGLLPRLTAMLPESSS